MPCVQSEMMLVLPKQNTYLRDWIGSLAFADMAAAEDMAVAKTNHGARQDRGVTN